MADIIPGIGLGELDFSGIEQKVRLAAPYVDWVQIDFADSTLVPAMTNWEFEKYKKLIESFTGNGHKLSFEAHLMVAAPEKYIKPLVDAGFHRIIAHVEANDPRIFLEQAEFESVETGLAIDGPTELEVLEPMLEDTDMVLVMGSEAGASGETLQPENIEKIRTLHNHLPDLPVEIDQGVNPETVKVLVDAGATLLVTTSYIFKVLDSAKVAAAIESLKSV